VIRTQNVPVCQLEGVPPMLSWDVAVSHVAFVVISNAASTTASGYIL
jgi:hypothetical protein